MRYPSILILKVRSVCALFACVTTQEPSTMVACATYRVPAPISAAAFAAATPAAGGAAAAEEKDAFNVVLAKAGAQKIQVIKVLREITGLGLKEVKDMTDKEGSVVKEGVKAADAQEMKKKLEEAGAVVELK